jgi:hypothetical protein
MGGRVVKQGSFLGFSVADMWEIYEAENPLAEMLMKIVAAATPTEVSDGFGAWLEGADARSLWHGDMFANRWTERRLSSK